MYVQDTDIFKFTSIRNQKKMLNNARRLRNVENVMFF